jgi:putative ABC transport system substrate-binding protein
MKLYDSGRPRRRLHGQGTQGGEAAELPVEQASKFELVVNLRTAKAIGIEFPTGILLRADEVIGVAACY